MNITLIQAELHWEDKEANLEMLNNTLEVVMDTDLIVLPEMFSTAFSNNSDSLWEEMGGNTVKWMLRQAKTKNAAITGSIIVRDNGEYFNRMIWAEPDGKIQHYDKRHLFRMAGEHDSFTAGKERVIVEFKGWRIMLQICYDLRFPVFARNRFVDGKYDYDLVLYVANWPEPRHNAWADLLRARAIENLSYCVGVNRVGEDGNGLTYKGGSAIINYLGRPIEEGNDRSCILQADLNMVHLRDFREKFPTGMDADAFTLMA